MVSLVIPDKWQQEAVRLLREGKDVVVDAPTGAGKTYIFELLYDSIRGQAVFTVPTRALANDKLAEWRARGWDVGISTGDIAENLEARVVVATLETQKDRFLRGEGPRLLVIDEYQLLADPVRGVNYELILSLAPAETHLLLLSGSVANPDDVVAWLRRIGRSAELVEHRERPVPLDEVILTDLPRRSLVRGYWPRLLSRALQADLGPVLVFAPRRKAAEELAQSLVNSLPPDEPLALSQEQGLIVGEPLAKLLRHRVAYHHSGLSYAVRAGVIEPLAKRGQLRVVVATMGLAAGINFSMRSVLVTGTHYLAGNFQRHVRPDELLQMFGRAGRRGLDETGYALVTHEVPRLFEAHPLRLKRAEPLDWPSLLAVMQKAAVSGQDPFQRAIEVSRRLFTTRAAVIGIEAYYREPDRPCGIRVDVERGRFVRRHKVEMRNLSGEWETQPQPTPTTLDAIWVRSPENRWRRALTLAGTIKDIGFGSLCRIRIDRNRFEYGKEVPVAVVSAGRWSPVKWLKKFLKEKYPLFAVKRAFSEGEFREIVMPLVTAKMGGQLHDVVERNNITVARFRFGHIDAQGYLGTDQRWLSNPETRRAYPDICLECRHRAECESLELVSTPAFAWRQLGLIDEKGFPTRRGVLFSFFNQGEGLAIAAALEEENYPVGDLLYDIGNLRAGHRFSLDDSPFGGRLGVVCQEAYRRAEFPGYLEMGVPPGYGAGASEVIRDVVEYQVPRQKLTNELLRAGDIERAVTEWRSLLRQIVHASDLQWDRWMQLKAEARKHVDSTKSPAQQRLPELLPAQMRMRIGNLKPMRQTGNGSGKG
jgi:superfamily II DNA/RNA helicase